MLTRIIRHFPIIAFLLFIHSLGQAHEIITDITSGKGHTCALTQSGTVQCWGLNGDGQLGDGTETTQSFSPVNVSGLTSSVIAISTKGYHTCALTINGSVHCWGKNDVGQLGNGLITNSRIPVDVTGLNSGVTAISTGYWHSCALTSSGGVKCWGYNYHGQLGDGTTTDSTVPVDVVGLSSGVSAISAGSEHTCALIEDGTVKCWGGNSKGQLADNSTIQRLTPVNVTGLSRGISYISAGEYHTCAITSSNSAQCWGDNLFGQLGNGTTIDSLVPSDVSGITSEIITLSAGYLHTCALTSDKIVKCWGLNDYGQLGDGTTLRSVTPVDVIGLYEITTLSTGENHTCALTLDGIVNCWGRNEYGQLGNGGADDSSSPVEVFFPSDLKADINQTLLNEFNQFLVNWTEDQENTAIVEDTNASLALSYGFSFEEVGDVNMASVSIENAPIEKGISTTQGGHPVLTTEEGKRVVFYPMPKNKHELIECVNETDMQNLDVENTEESMNILLEGTCSNEVYYGEQSDILMGFCKEETILRRRVSNRIHKITTFNPLIEPSAERICARTTVSQDICEQLGVHIEKKAQTRSNQLEQEIGYVVYPNGTVQEFYPTVFSPPIFMNEARKIQGIEDIYLNVNGSFTAIYLGQYIKLQPTFEVLSEDLEEGELPVEPSITIQPDNTLRYVIQHDNAVLTSTLLLTVLPPDVPEVETFIEQAQAFAGVSSIAYNEEEKTFEGVYHGQNFRLIPTYDIQRVELAESDNVVLNISVHEDGQSLSYTVQQGLQQITVTMLIELF